MSKLMIRALLLATVALLLPGSAWAGTSPWGWLDKLSGPGPFTANGRLFVPVPITTTKSRDKIVTFGEGLDDRRVYVVFETARFTGETNPNFAGAVNITTLHGVVFVHPGGWRKPKSPLSAFDFGAGLGLYRFSGAGVISDGAADGAFSRGAIPLRLRLTPSELAAGRLSPKWRNGLAVFSYMIGWDLLPGTFSGHQFVLTSKGAGYHSSGNAPFTCGLIIDITPVLFGR
jgi:hypothetical protein